MTLGRWPALPSFHLFLLHNVCVNIPRGHRPSTMITPHLAGPQGRTLSSINPVLWAWGDQGPSCGPQFHILTQLPAPGKLPAHCGGGGALGEGSAEQNRTGLGGAQAPRGASCALGTADRVPRLI